MVSDGFTPSAVGKTEPSTTKKIAQLVVLKIGVDHTGCGICSES